MAAQQTKVRTCLWFESGGEEAAALYVSLLPGSRIESEMRHDPEKPAMTVEFTLAGTPYQILNGGPHYKLSPAASISVLTKDQAETDHLWNALTANGGAESMCGWLIDRFGVSWQIVPEQLMACMTSPDAAATQRAMKAMMQMKRIDIAAIEAAFDGK